MSILNYIINQSVVKFRRYRANRKYARTHAHTHARTHARTDRNLTPPQISIAIGGGGVET